jgi:hypothetical protein
VTPRAVVVVLAAGCAGCAGRPGTTTARGHYYTDNSGVDVATALVETTQQVGSRWSVSGRALVDRITLTRHPLDPADPGAGGQPTGHPDHHPDTVTSASATAGGGSVANKNRVEGRVRVERSADLDDRPIRMWSTARGSTEPDYDSVSASVGSSIELAERNTAISLELGAGHDRVAPVEAPPGQQASWPATHQRITASLAGSQVVTRSIILTAGIAVTAQRGRLANPYRRALVRTSLFPEVVPDARDRWTGFVGTSASLTRRAALHARLGGYRDSWGVWAFIPELAAVHEITERGLVTASYRWYRQRQADFWEARYDALEPLLSGDPRLGPVRAHALGAHLRWRLRGEDDSDAGAVVIDAGYQLDLMDFPLYATDRIVGHVATLGAILAY